MSDEFIQTIKEYVEIDDNIKEAEKALKALKGRRTDLQEAIMQYMKSQNWDVCNTSTGKLAIKKSVTKKAIPQKQMQSILGEYMGDHQKMQEAYDFAMSKREVSEKNVLKRVG